MGGIEAAHGQYIVMGDADDSYDFLDVPRFVERQQTRHSMIHDLRKNGNRALSRYRIPVLCWHRRQTVDPAGEHSGPRRPAMVKLSVPDGDRKL